MKILQSDNEKHLRMCLHEQSYMNAKTKTVKKENKIENKHTDTHTPRIQSNENVTWLVSFNACNALLLYKYICILLLVCQQGIITRRMRWKNNKMKKVTVMERRRQKKTIRYCREMHSNNVSAFQVEFRTWMSVKLTQFWASSLILSLWAKFYQTRLRSRIQNVT